MKPLVAGFDEALRIDVDDMPAHAPIIMIIVNSHSGGTFQDVEVHITLDKDFVLQYMY